MKTNSSDDSCKIDNLCVQNTATVVHNLGPWKTMHSLSLEQLCSHECIVLHDWLEARAQKMQQKKHPSLITKLVS